MPNCFMKMSGNGGSVKGMINLNNRSNEDCESRHDKEVKEDKTKNDNTVPA